MTFCASPVSVGLPVYIWLYDRYCHRFFWESHYLWAIHIVLRTKTVHKIRQIGEFKDRLLQWSRRFETVVWLDSNRHDDRFGGYDAVLAVDAYSSLKTDHRQAFDKLKEYLDTINDWAFGYLSYDLKNDIEKLSSNNFDGLDFPDLFFFQPKKLFLIKEGKVQICYLDSVAHERDGDLKEINELFLDKVPSLPQEKIKIKLRTSKDRYFEKFSDMLAHIYRGDIYEANLCQEFYASGVTINPCDTYIWLNRISRTPFSAYFRSGGCYAMSASPERYLKKIGHTVISQPIKGTAKRSDNIVEDQALRKRLEKSEKDRSENIMIVDLVRNDLSRTAAKGSVEVEELCKVHTFEQVHQMISTVKSRVANGTHPVDVIRTTFPMGSMTGAPKISAMKIIEQLEDAKRGLYSGAIGYFSPKGDFDFNVVIRTILYNAERQYVSYSVGGAITAKSNPHSEYEECLIKAKAMREVLER